MPAINMTVMFTQHRQKHHRQQLSVCYELYAIRETSLRFLPQQNVHLTLPEVHFHYRGHGKLAFTSFYSLTVRFGSGSDGQTIWDCLVRFDLVM